VGAGTSAAPRTSSKSSPPSKTQEHRLSKFGDARVQPARWKPGSREGKVEFLGTVQKRISYSQLWEYCSSVSSSRRADPMHARRRIYTWRGAIGRHMGPFLTLVNGHCLSFGQIRSHQVAIIDRFSPILSRSTLTVNQKCALHNIFIN
jgi:hypothetical protein